VLDFGLSGFVFGAEGALQKLTRTGNIVGTVHYMSPEVCRGQMADGRSDVYSLGCVLYQCLTGQAPFSSDDPMNMLYRHVHEMPARLRHDASIPPALEAVVFKAIQKDPEARFQTMAEFGKALNAVQGNADITLGPVKFEISAQEQRKPNKVGISVAVVLLIPLVVGGYLFLNKPREQPSCWLRDRRAESIQHYRAALAAASTRKQRYLSQLAIGRYWIENPCDGPKCNEAVAALEDAVRLAESQQEKDVARCLLGLTAYALGDTDRAWELFQNHPWEQLASSDDRFVKGFGTRSVMHRYAAVALNRKPPAYKVAREMLVSLIENPGPVDSTGMLRQFEFELARCDHEDPNATAAQKAAALKTFKRVVPDLVAAPERLAYIRKVIGAAEYERAIAVPSTIVLPENNDSRLQEVFSGDPLMANIALKTEKAYNSRQADVLDVVKVANRFGGALLAGDKEHLQAAFEYAKQVRAAHSDDEETANLIDLYCGIAAYEGGDFSKAINILQREPWVVADSSDKPILREVAEVSLGGAYLRQNKPRQAIQLLSPYADAKSIRGAAYVSNRCRGCILLALAWLEDGDVARTAEAKEIIARFAGEHLLIFSEDERQFVKAKLSKHKL
jgi:tetratricopeptide (TPR) repeat protein